MLLSPRSEWKLWLAMKLVSWQLPQVRIVETGAPLCSTFCPFASSMAKTGCSGDSGLTVSGADWAVA